MENKASYESWVSSIKRNFDDADRDADGELTFDDGYKFLRSAQDPLSYSEAALNN